MTPALHRSSVADQAAEAHCSSETCFSRSVGLPSMGKATSEIKCKVPDEVKDDFIKLARTAGLSESELLRDIVMVRLYGHEAVARMHSERLRVAAGLGQETAL